MIATALHQWEDGDRRLRASPEPEKLAYERALSAVLRDLRKRLGSKFTLEELAAFYDSGTDWANASAWIVDAAFARYAREAADFAGGRHLSI